jgi:hypothetical protein
MTTKINGPDPEKLRQLTGESIKTIAITLGDEARAVAKRLREEANAIEAMADENAHAALEAFSGLADRVAACFQQFNDARLTLQSHQQMIAQLSAKTQAFDVAKSSETKSEALLLAVEHAVIPETKKITKGT